MNFVNEVPGDGKSGRPWLYKITVKFIPEFRLVQLSTMASEAKKAKLEENGCSDKKAEVQSLVKVNPEVPSLVNVDPEVQSLVNVSPEVQEELTSFAGFKITKILSENSERKNVCVEGTFSGERRSVVVLERLPLREELLSRILQVGTLLELKIH